MPYFGKFSHAENGNVRTVTEPEVIVLGTSLETEITKAGKRR